MSVVFTVIEEDLRYLKYVKLFSEPTEETYIQKAKQTEFRQTYFIYLPPGQMYLNYTTAS